MLRRLFFLVLVLSGLAGTSWAGLQLLAVQRPLARATAEMDAGRPAAAQIILRNLIKTDPRNVDAHVMLANTQLLLADWVGAEKELKIARALKFDRAKLMPLLARSYVMQQRYNDVLAEIPANPPNPDDRAVNLLFRSMAYVGLGDLGQAKASIDAAAEINPEFPPILLQSARVAIMRKNLPEADRKVSKALDLDPHNVESLMVKADIQAQRWDSVGALNTLALAVAVAPFSPTVRLARIPLLLAGGLDKTAQQDVDAVLDVSRNDAGGVYYNAVMMFRAKQWADANIEFDKLGFMTDQYPKSLLFKGQAFLALNQVESGLDSLTRFLRLQPADAEGVRLASQLQLKLERPDKAAEIIARAISAGLKDAQAYDQLGRAYFMLGRLSDSIDTYRKAVAMAPERKDYAAHLAAAQTRFGETPVSAEASSQAPE